MRVIAGRFGGRRLVAPKGRTTTRPTSDRVREAIFSMLGDLGEEEDARVLDLFAGTGALGIEALSRGAARAVFVERDGAALAALRANLSALGLGEERAEVRRGEALAALRSARERAETYDLVLIDPPYRRAGAMGGEPRRPLRRCSRRRRAWSWRAIAGRHWSCPGGRSRENGAMAIRRSQSTGTLDPTAGPGPAAAGGRPGR